MMKVVFWSGEHLSKALGATALKQATAAIAASAVKQARVATALKQALVATAVKQALVATALKQATELADTVQVIIINGGRRIMNTLTLKAWSS
mmetsp:Transcript_11586/g.19856  ORF Transcript_11586/g.19856 Transcript_11586/m.19856 type:complete len:93 (+) Transcript_11586:54-332(+)